MRAGSGGRGSASFRREPFIPKGGPDGGDGGRGGSIILVAGTSQSSLNAYASRRSWRAQDGAAGAGARKEGRGGADVELEVPVGTAVVDDATGTELADLDAEGARYTVARGGDGGRGNLHFKTAVNRSPLLAEPGRAGEQRWIRLELKLIAEVGLVGAPNAGKSSLLAAVSAANPKIGAYPFTTLDPELGVAYPSDGQRLLIADIPGLIEGAARGAGLGHRFLRHVERTRVLAFVIDGAAPQPWLTLRSLRQELRSYSPSLARRPSLVVVNKIDLPAARALAGRTRRRGVMYCSALTGEGLPELVEALRAAVLRAPAPSSTAMVAPVQLPARRRGAPPLVLKRAWGFEVGGPRVEGLVARTDFESEPSLERFQALLDRIGVSAALVEAGAQPGDTVRIRDLEFEYQP